MPGLQFNHPLNTVRWFHPNVDGTRAEEILKGQKIGNFLVRHSHSRRGYVITCMTTADIIHVPVEVKSGCFVIEGIRDGFATLVELLAHCMKNNPRTGSTVVPLLNPVHSNDPTNERWFHGQISSFQAEQFLKKKGKNGHFLVRESMSQPGQFALSVRVKENVHHLRINFKNDRYDLGNPGESFLSLVELIQKYQTMTLVQSGNERIVLRKPAPATRFAASAIAQRMAELETPTKMGQESKSGYYEEFEHLQHELSQLQLRKEAERPENKVKNRFKNILPYDHSRVALKDKNNQLLPLGSNYINANYIKFSEEDENGRKRTMKSYIATQGCLSDTIGDFWYMIWQEKCRVIAILTKLVEKGKNKCMRYWPDENELSIERDTPDGGKVRVLRQDEQPINESIQRTFKLTKFNSDGEEEGAAVTITQFHFTVWPDKQVPSDPVPVINFSQAVDQKWKEQSQGPVTVHCSAGIGRTGTLIIINMLINQLRQHGYNCEMDIQKTVSMVRQQRSGMVQTEAQYKFIYTAMSRFVEHESPYGLLPIVQPDEGPIYSNIQPTKPPPPSKKPSIKPNPKPPVPPKKK